MSIQLDGHLTYPKPKKHGEGKQQQAGKATGSGDGTPTEAPGDVAAATAASPIIWEGSWHYSQKQTRGSNAPCSFKYVFVGPHGKKPPGVDGRDEGGRRSTDAPVSTTNLGSTKPEDTAQQTRGLVLHSDIEQSGESKLVDSSKQTGEKDQAVADAPQQTPGAASPVAADGAVATAPTVNSGVGSSAASATATCVEVKAIETTRAATQQPRPSLNVDVSLAANGSVVAMASANGGGDARNAAAGDGSQSTVPLTPEQLALYGPYGDGRLPSGKWSGQFAVKARGQEFMVTETFVLEFGSNWPSTQSRPAAATAVPSSPGVTRGVMEARPAASPSSLSAVSGGEITKTQPSAEAMPADLTIAEEPKTESDSNPWAGSKKAAGEGKAEAKEVGTAADAAEELAAGVALAPETVAAIKSPRPAATVVEGPAAASTTTLASSPTETSALTVAAVEELVPIPPVVTVSGWGGNRYGEFTLTGGHERATGRLDLTRFYFEKPKPRLTAAAAAAAASRAAGGGSGISHQKKKRPLPPGASPPQDPGPSLAERRTKRTRQPNQRLFDDEIISLSHHAETSGNISKRKSEAAAAAAAAATAATATATTITNNTTAGASANSPAEDGAGWGFGAFAGRSPDVVSSGGGESRQESKSKSRKPRDRERDLLMEQTRRAKRRAQLSNPFSGIGGSGGGGGPGTTSASNSFFSSEDAAVAELTERSRAGREALAGADLSALIGTENEQDRVLKEALVNMEKEQAGLEAEAQAAADAEVETQTRATDPANSSRGGRRGLRGGLPQERWRSLFLDEESGEIYEGGWRGGRRHGKGMCVYANQNIYEGTWKDGKEHGFGRIMRGNRVLIFEGEFVDGKLCGRGRHADESGEVYEGEWKDNARHGKGVYRFATTLDVNATTTAITTATIVSAGSTDGAMKTSDSTAGTAVAGGAKEVASGVTGGVACTESGGVAGITGVQPSLDVGVVETPGGGMMMTTTYDGDFKDNLRCGRGVQTWPGGSYDGDWLNDRKHGRGVLRTDDGFLYDGGWVDDLPEGRGICIHPDGQRYEGVFRGGKKEGRGTLAFANGASYEGRFRDDAIDGQGMLQILKPVEDDMGGWMIPIQFQSDIERIHVKAGFDKGGL